MKKNTILTINFYFMKTTKKRIKPIHIYNKKKRAPYGAPQSIMR